MSRLTTRTISSLHNGVSRQPAILRSADQTEEEVNTWGKIASGVGRRPPTVHIANLTLPSGDVFIHHINRDVGERYIVVIANGDIKVFDQSTGAEMTVTAPGGLGYLSGPATAFNAVTVADYTFIVNSQKLVTLDELGADTVAPPAYTYIPGGSQTQNQYVNEFEPGDPLPLGGSFGAFDPVQYTPNPTAPGGITGEVQKFEDLPTTATDGQVYRVNGSAETGFVSYYVRRNGTVWDETVAPGIRNALAASTMPHALIRKADGTFEFVPFSWRARRVGDEATNPAPPFVGRAIRDVFFYQNRLGFLTDETVVFSVAGDYGDFWRRTVLDYLDADVLAVSATTTDVAVLDYAVPFNDGIMLFSAQRQFSLSNGEAGLSAASVEINPVTSYVTSPGVRPAPLGSQVYFASQQGRYTTVQEYTRLDGSDATDAAEITAHVPGYIPSGVSRLIPAPDMNALIALVSNSAAKNEAYVYQFFWDRDRKIQSAWRKWDFGTAQVLSSAFVDGRLYLVMKRGAAYSLESLDLRDQAVSANQDHLIYLDRQVSLTGTYNAGTNRTTFTLPYTPAAAKLRLVRGATAAYPESVISSTKWTLTGNVVSVEGNESGVPVTLGEAYRTYLKFSRQFPMDYQGRPLTTGRLQLHTWSVTYTDTAFFTAEVQPYGDNPNIPEPDRTALIQFSGQLLGEASFQVGRQAYRTGTFTFSVAGEASLATIALSNETPFASTFVSAEWEGLFFSRAL